MKTKILTFIPLTALFCLASCGTPVPNDVDFTISDLTEVQELHSDLQNEFINQEDILTYCKDHSSEFGKINQFAPLPIKLSWSVTNDLNINADRYYVWVSEDNNFSDEVKFETRECKYDLYNSKVGTKYFWKVEAVYNRTSFFSKTHNFETKDEKIRNIQADGVTNIRDLGGFSLENGGKLKQGMIYRSAQFNYDKNDPKAVPSEPNQMGKDILINQLKIKTDVDIRRTIKEHKDETLGITSSPIGDKVKYVPLPMYYVNTQGNTLSDKDNAPKIKAFFELLADESNYPVIFHCQRGTDRTGALAYAIEAMCGVSANDMALDYCFSNLANIGSPIDVTRYTYSMGYVNQITNYSKGSTLAEKAMNYVMDKTGVSQQTLTSMVNLLTERK